MVMEAAILLRAYLSHCFLLAREAGQRDLAATLEGLLRGRLIRASREGGLPSLVRALQGLEPAGLALGLAPNRVLALLQGEKPTAHELERLERLVDLLPAESRQGGRPPTKLRGVYRRLASLLGGVTPFAQALGVSRLTVYRWSAEGKKLSPAAQQRLAEALLELERR